MDDGSDDGTRRYLAELAVQDDRFSYIFQSHSQGACVARNAAIAIANGEYMTGMDDDDEMTPNRLEQFVANINDDAAFLFAPLIWSYGKRQRIIRYKHSTIDLNTLLSINYVGNQVFVATDKLKAVGGFDEDMPACQDWDTWIRLAKAFGNGHMVGEASYIVHTDHSLNRISSSPNKVLGQRKIIEKFKDISTSENQKSQKFLLLKFEGKPMTLGQLFSLTTKQNFRLSLGYFLGSNLAFFSKMRMKLLKG